MCYHAVFGDSALKGEGTNTGKTPNWGALELGCLRMEGVADPRYTHLPTCYHVKIGSSASKGVCICEGLRRFGVFLLVVLMC